MEYALISGLKCSKYPKGWESQAESKSFKDRHFRNEEQHTVINEAQPSGQATEVGNTIHVQPMSEATRDDLPVVTLGYSPIHMSIPSTMYGPEARQSEKVDWCTVKAYIDQQFSLMGSKISLLPSKIIMSLQQQNIHVEGQQSSHSERQHTHVEEEHSPHFERQPLMLKSNILLIMKSNLYRMMLKVNLIKLCEKIQRGGDCAVYAIKFIEFDMAGLSFESLSDDRMSFYRKKMTVDIFLSTMGPLVICV
uniref:Ubiquitin-like protease family profile domain-containing protein n=1 Tax=Cannabis sativa TaxID=3483 RepID=A0A803PA24_CANSA